jgi:hyperosmotically inducible protein
MPYHPLRQRLLLASLGAAVLALSLAGCTKPPESAAASVPKTSVGTAIDDSVLTTKVKSGLLGDADVKSFDIQAVTRKGEVQLSGFVDNQLQIDRAVMLVRAIEGVTGVDNKLALKGAATTIGNKVDDGIVTTQVKAALIADEKVKSSDIGVVTRKGEVQLSGFVDSQGQMDRAVLVARGIEGVSNVSNEMSLKK